MEYNVCECGKHYPVTETACPDCLRQPTFHPDAKLAKMARSAISAERRDPTYDDDDVQLGATERMTERLLKQGDPRPATELSDLAYDAVADALWKEGPGL